MSYGAKKPLSNPLQKSRAEAAKKREDAVKNETRLNLEEQIRVKAQREEAEREAEKIESEKRDEFHRAKERLIEEEKQKLIDAHEKKMTGEEEEDKMEVDDEITINYRKVAKSPLQINRAKAMASSIIMPDGTVLLFLSGK